MKHTYFFFYIFAFLFVINKLNYVCSGPPVLILTNEPFCGRINVLPAGDNESSNHNADNFDEPDILPEVNLNSNYCTPPPAPESDEASALITNPFAALLDHQYSKLNSSLDDGVNVESDDGSSVNSDDLNLLLAADLNLDLYNPTNENTTSRFYTADPEDTTSRSVKNVQPTPKVVPKNNPFVGLVRSESSDSSTNQIFRTEVALEINPFVRLVRTESSDSSTNQIAPTEEVASEINPFAGLKNLENHDVSKAGPSSSRKKKNNKGGYSEKRFIDGCSHKITGKDRKDPNLW